MKPATRKTLLPLAAGLLGGLLLSSAWATATEPQDPMDGPGKEHGLLKEMAGKFDVVTELRFTPDADPFPIAGTSDSKVILGGRFLLTRSVTGSGPDATESLNIMGYDRLQGMYTLISMDTKGTQMNYFSGRRGRDGSIALSDLTRTVSVVMDWDDEDRMEQTIYLPSGKGKETFPFARSVMTEKPKDDSKPADKKKK